MPLADLSGPADLIEWGEGDVRDAMEAFDPQTTDIQVNGRVVGVYAHRAGVTVAAWWSPLLLGVVYPDPRTQSPRARFDCPVEAIAEGLRLARERQSSRT